MPAAATSRADDPAGTYKSRWGLRPTPDPLSPLYAVRAVTARGERFLEGRQAGRHLMMRRVHVPNATLGWSDLLHALARPLDVTEAERAIERLTGAPHAVLFATARAAIAAAVASLAPGGRVALPAYTCIATADAVLHAGAEPVYADVDERGIVPADGWPDSDIVLVQDTYGFTAGFPEGRTAIRDAAHRADLLLNVTGSAVISSFGAGKVADGRRWRRHSDRRPGTR